MSKAKNTEITKKKERLIKEIYIIVLSTIILILGSIYLNKYMLKSNERRKNEILEIKQQFALLKQDIKDFENKLLIATNQKKIWDTNITDRQKNTIEITEKYINYLVNDLNEKSLIQNFTFSLTPSTLITTNEYDKNVKIFHKKLTLQFGCLTEFDVFNFLNNFKSNINSFFIIERLNLKKIKEADKNFARLLVNGKPTPLMLAEIVINLYYIQTTR